MNEQLVVKNFGPIKDATVDFKRVTVFIGPTGGGKSTLAKLAAIFRDSSYSEIASGESAKSGCLDDYQLGNFKTSGSAAFFESIDFKKSIKFENENILLALSKKHDDSVMHEFENSSTLLQEAKLILTQATAENNAEKKNSLLDNVAFLLGKIDNSKINRRQIVQDAAYYLSPVYIPSNRAFAAAITSSLAGLMRDDIGLPKELLNFINYFFQVRDDIDSVDIPFLGVNYFRHDNKDFISFAPKESAILLHETASGIQSVTPMMVLLEYLSRNTEQAQSFIIEEPELNLYPTAQQGLLNWLVEKCTKGENDLTITTHSPYLLAHFNTLLFAYQVAQNHPERADEIARVVPRESWINPAEFAAYHVEGQKENGVRSIVNPETGLISYNGLDAIASAEATEFEKLLDINAGLAVEW